MNRVRKEGDGKESKGGRGEGEEGKEKNRVSLHYVLKCSPIVERAVGFLILPSLPPLPPPSPSLPSPHLLPFKFVNSPSESVCTTVESIGPLPTVKA